MRPPHQPRQPGHRLLVGSQIDAGVFVSKFAHEHPAQKRESPCETGDSTGRNPKASTRSRASVTASVFRELHGWNSANRTSRKVAIRCNSAWRFLVSPNLPG